MHRLHQDSLPFAAVHRRSSRGLAASCATLLLGLLLVAGTTATARAQETGPPRSIARQWNEVLLEAIRRDFARPTVHARNLFHVSAAMWDAWAIHDVIASPYFLGRTQANGASCALAPDVLANYRRALEGTGIAAAREAAISHAAHRMLIARFDRSPGRGETRTRSNELLASLGLDGDLDSIDLADEPLPAVLGNLVADCILRLGATDGSNEVKDFANLAYAPVNTPLDPTFPGNPGVEFPDRWQPLELNVFVDQSGNRTSTPLFLGAEWGDVLPFSLTAADRGTVMRDGEPRSVYLDPGPPDRLGDDPAANAPFLAGHALVALWSAHLDPADGVTVDISPAAIGAGEPPPLTREALLDFYDAREGGTPATGHPINPATGAPYATNRVPRGDYTRVLAEFWADGPDSETPPGHWFRLYNEAVADHPDFERRLGGRGEPLSPLAFDVHTYLLLGGAMHDSAIAAWSAKGAYDSARPVSALRYLANRGQSSDPAGANYAPDGLPIVPGRLELVAAGDRLAGNGGVNVGKTKVRAWRGPAFIRNPATDIAGVDWILLENWWPYQRPTFVTPPFAGYVSGHSTFSRAAAEVLTALTGDPFFPGGLAEFTARRDDFLVFEEGPSVDVVLQWATYRDAADQTSLSRIWGGIHPPVDDLPGRSIGTRVAERARARAATFFDGTAPPSDVMSGSGGGGEGGGGSGGGGGGCSIARVNGAGFDPLLGSLLLLAAVAVLPVVRRPGSRRSAGRSHQDARTREDVRTQGS